jgi:hypothetical protein
MIYANFAHDEKTGIFMNLRRWYGFLLVGRLRQEGGTSLHFINFA